MTEDLLRRLRHADPARSREQSAPSTSIRDLMEAAMQTTPPKNTTRTGTPTHSTGTLAVRTAAIISSTFVP